MKRQVIGPVLALCAIFPCASCRRVDEREFAIDVPRLSAGVTNSIEKVLAGYSGVRKSSIRFDLENKRVSLVYDSMLVAKKNLEISIAELGLEANGVTPGSVGKEPL